MDAVLEKKALTEISARTFLILNLAMSYFDSPHPCGSPDVVATKLWPSAISNCSCNLSHELSHIQIKQQQLKIKKPQ